MKFWLAHAKELNSKIIKDDPVKRSNFIVYSDAGATGCSAHLELNGEQICHREWESHERNKSSTWRALAAIEYALNAYHSIVKGSYLKWFSDSQSAVKIIQVGSMKEGLHDLAIRIFEFCAMNDIHLNIQWIPRTELERADYISRIIDIDDWQLTAVASSSLKSYGVRTRLTALQIITIRKLTSIFQDSGIQVVTG